jgi:hypothetical protein
MSNKSNLRKPESIIKVVETFEEARIHTSALAQRSIGGICIKGVATGRSSEYWGENSELRDFAHIATTSTQGILAEPFDLKIRRLPRKRRTRKIGKITLFTTDSRMHFDGFTEEKFYPGEEFSNCFIRFPLIRPHLYMGVSHHITQKGQTTFVMERLSESKAEEMARNQLRGSEGVVDTNRLVIPLKGEAVELEAGDYMALHSYGVYKQPLFVHGSTNSSADRRSIAYNPHEMSEFTIDDIYTIRREKIKIEL